MKKVKTEKVFLILLFPLSLGIFFLSLRKPPIKDWLLVYFFNAATNAILDKLLVSYNKVKYPIRLLPKIFETHILFDYILYPTATILYNQMTYKDNPVKIFLKLFYFSIPLLLIEYWAERKTNLIKWKKGWNWHHSFLSITAKSFLTRSLISLVRKTSKKQEKYT